MLLSKGGVGLEDPSSECLDGGGGGGRCDVGGRVCV